METESYTAPSYWASYLINGDDSGLSQEEIAQADAWIREIDLGDPVDVEEIGFLHRHDAFDACPFAADCGRYTFLI